MQMFSKAAHISNDDSWPWAYSAYCWYSATDLNPPFLAWKLLHSELVNSFSLYVNFFICYFPHRMLTVKVMRYVWLQNVQNEGRGQSELQRQNEISHFRSATKWHMVMFKWLSPEMVVVIMTGAKEEIRCHCCTAAKPEHGDGGLRWMGDSAKNTILTRYTTAHFLFHTVSKRDLKASYCYRPNKFSD